MHILLNQPLMTLLLLLLLLLLLKSNKNRYGISLSLRKYQHLVTKHGDALDIVDIRDMNRFADIHSIGGRHLTSKDVNLSRDRILLIVHDSDIKLAKYAKYKRMKPFSNRIYQCNMTEYNLKQYHLMDAGALIGNDSLPLIKNSESAS